MKTILNILFISSIFSFIFSCRQIPDEEEIDSVYISLNNPVSVKIKFHGFEYEKSSPINTIISENNTEVGEGDFLDNNKLEENTYYGDFIYTKVETIPENNEYAASLGLSAAVKGNTFPSEAIYTILAYMKIGNKYIFHKKAEFTGNDRNPKIVLNGDQNYTIIVISSGKNKALQIHNLEDFDKVCFFYSELLTKNFYYQKIENFTINGNINSPLNIKFKKPSSVRIVLDTSKLVRDDEGISIESVSNARITYKIPTELKLGNIGSTMKFEEITIPISNFTKDMAGMIWISEFINILAIDNQTEAKIYAEVKVNGIAHNSSIKGFTIKVKPEFRQTVRFKHTTCGAYSGPNKTNFREFMCHNLGDIQDDGSVELWKDKNESYQFAWGRKNPVTKNDNNLYEIGNVWKQEENPCPTDFRIPSKDEWLSILDEKNNKIEPIKSPTGENIGYSIGGRLSLFDYGWDDFRSWVWTSNPIPPRESVDRRDAYSICITEVPPGSLSIGKKLGLYKDRKRYGQAVRCIRKLPNE